MYKSKRNKIRIKRN